MFNLRKTHFVMFKVMHSVGFKIDIVGTCDQSTENTLKMEICKTIIQACVAAASQDKVDEENNLSSDGEHWML